MILLPHPLPLRTDETSLGLRRVVVPTSVGEVVVRTGRQTGGPATILLHGAAGSWSTWTPLIVAADAAGEPLTDIVALDLPGWGQSGDSDRIGSVGDLSDAVAEVARALGHRSWRLVGHSLGGFVALDVAARHPQGTLGVTLVSASGAAVRDAVALPVRGGAALPWFAGMLLAMRTLAVLGRAGTGVVRLLGRLGALPVLAAPLFAAPVHPTVVAALGDEVRPAAFARAARLAAAYDERAWTTVSCPVHSVRGIRDVFAGEADAAAFARALPRFRETRLADAGHFAHIERPDAVLAALRAPTRTPRRATPTPRSPAARPALTPASRIHTRTTRSTR